MAKLQKLITQQEVSALPSAVEKPKIEKAKTAKTKVQASKKSPNSVCKISEEERRQMIATNAYFRAQSRNFFPYEENDDWLAAEAEIDEILDKSRLD